MTKCVYIIKHEHNAYDPNDITATEVDIVGFVEDEDVAKEFCLKRNGYLREYGPYSYECVSEFTKQEMEEE